MPSFPKIHCLPMIWVEKHCSEDLLNLYWHILYLCFFPSVSLRPCLFFGETPLQGYLRQCLQLDQVSLPLQLFCWVLIMQPACCPAHPLWHVQATEVITVYSILFSFAAETATGISETVRFFTQDVNNYLYAQEIGPGTAGSACLQHCLESHLEKSHTSQVNI